MKDQRMTCKYCGGSNILFSAAVQWNNEQEIYEVTEINYKGHYCEDCEGECSVE